jgi:hypothetical protein
MQIAGLHTPGQRFRLDNNVNAPAAFWITPRTLQANHIPAFAVVIGASMGHAAQDLKFAPGGGTAIGDSGGVG